MFKKSLPLALVAIAGCVALTPTAQKPDSTAQSANPTSAPSAQVAQKASPTPVPTPTPMPSPTPVPTPLPKSILKIIIPRPGNSDPVGLEGPVLYGKFGALDGRSYGIGSGGTGGGVRGIASSTSGDMYIQIFVPTDSIPVLCPACDMNVGKEFGNYAIFRKTRVENDFEFVAMAEKTVIGKEGGQDQGKVSYRYEGQDFAFSKLSEAASVSIAPWVVKGIDLAKKEISFDVSVWPQNTGSLKLADVNGGDFFGINMNTWRREQNSGNPCTTQECEATRALASVRERTAFTGAKAYFFGRGAIVSDPQLGDGSPNTTIFRVSETGAREIVGKSIAAYFAKFLYGSMLVHNFVYSRADGKYYVLAGSSGGMSLYRVSEDALVP